MMLLLVISKLLGPTMRLQDVQSRHSTINRWFETVIHEVCGRNTKCLSLTISIVQLLLYSFSLEIIRGGG